ncbi:MBL fold metallo-hydrolase [Massilia yuzhufengensis]|uniref:L-ascorbate metabolism protein UlaG, beta-lactamase superfamily n=1 Tax=Massilia yuzhufengensis TaxID=1164594 RepID=A0A1I1EG91_9BURK|nr:MBL fold metallo-hydrolase [Massilia yuzhufengensis]SFB85766.1 L-ascorbate metabolism protein UlaG, beta-lactamase superfamily [Massilia yuzhufengensis]
MPAVRLFQFCVLLASLCGAAGLVRAADAPATPVQGEIFTLQLPAGSAPAADTSTGTAQFIGTATVIIRFQGFTILTDPNFLPKGGQAQLGYGITAERKTSPAISFDKLPPIDLVVLSHFHDDHFDKLVQERLKPATPIISPKEASERLKRMGFTHTYGLSTWDRVDVSKGEARLRITATPARHGPAGVAVLLPKTMGAVLDFGANAALPDYRIYISGDTLVYDDTGAIPQRFPNIDLALLHLGGLRIPGGVKLTMDGKDGVRMMQVVRPKIAVPIHVDDYDVFTSPLEEFAREVKAAGLEKEVVYLAHGETYSFSPAQR